MEFKSQKPEKSQKFKNKMTAFRPTVLLLKLKRQDLYCLLLTVLNMARIWFPGFGLEFGTGTFPKTVSEPEQQ
jgi:hypothetical protein